MPYDKQMIAAESSTYCDFSIDLQLLTQADPAMTSGVIILKIECYRVQINSVMIRVAQHGAAKLLLLNAKAVTDQHRHDMRQIVKGKDEVEIVMRTSDPAKQGIYAPATIEPCRHAYRRQQVKDV